MKWIRKWKIPHTVLERRILSFSSYKNHKLKVKLWWAGAHERKMRAFFVLFVLSEENFFKICVLSQCIVYWIHFWNKHTFTYQKTLLHTLLLLVFKIVKSLQNILRMFVDLVELLLHFLLLICIFLKVNWSYSQTLQLQKIFAKLLFPSFVRKITKFLLVGVLKWKLMDFKRVNLVCLKDCDVLYSWLWYVNPKV